jgi:hypothetical protein
VVLITSLTGLAAVAFAASPSETRKAQITFAPGQNGSATAECRRGTRVVSAGFDGPGFAAAGAGPYVITTGSLRMSSRRWRTFGQNLGGDRGDLVSYAYCSEELPRLKAKERHEQVAAGEGGSATARCGRGREAVAGGFGLDFSSHLHEGIFVVTSMRAGARGWRVRGYNSEQVPRSFAVIVYCAAERVGLRTRDAAPTHSKTSAMISSKARCHRNEVAISGGFRGTLDGEQDLTLVFQSKRASRRGWRASAGAYPSDGGSVKLNAQVYCLGKG